MMPGRPGHAEACDPLQRRPEQFAAKDLHGLAAQVLRRLPRGESLGGYGNAQASTAAFGAVLTSILRGCARSTSGTVTRSTPPS